MKHTLKVTTPTDLSVVMTRSFDAPARLVFTAMSKPEFIKRWLFLPSGWQMTVCEEDVRVGGKFHWAWAGPDGKTAMTMRGEYKDVVPNKKMSRVEAFEFEGAPNPCEQFATIELTEDSGQTHVKITVEFATKEARDGMVCSGMEHGVSTGYDTLERMLAAGEIK